MPLDAKEIDALRKKICAVKKKDGELVALKLISKKKGEESLPVIIKILEDVYSELRILRTNDYDLEQTQRFVSYAIPLLTEADKKQNVNPMNLIGVTREQIINDMTQLVDYAGKIKVTNETLILWEEVSLWMEGLYKRVYDKSKKEKDGKTVALDKNGAPYRIDLTDKGFYLIFKLTKYQVSCYYHQAASAINLKISEYREEIAKLQPPLPAIHSPIQIENPIPVVLNNNSQNNVTNEQIRVVPIVSDNVVEITRTTEISRNHEITKKELAPVLLDRNYVRSHGIYLLGQFKEESDEVRFHILMGVLDELSPEQKACLNNFKEIIHASLESYNSRYFTTHWLPTFWFPRPHVEEVQEKMEMIDASDDSTQYLKILYALWIEMKGKNSKSVKYKAGCLLDNAYTILLNCAEQNQNEHAINHALRN